MRVSAFPILGIVVLALSNLWARPTLAERIGTPGYLGIIVALLACHFALKSIERRA